MLGVAKSSRSHAGVLGPGRGHRLHVKGHGHSMEDQGGGQGPQGSMVRKDHCKGSVGHVEVLHYKANEGHDEVYCTGSEGHVQVLHCKGKEVHDEELY